LGVQRYQGKEVLTLHRDYFRLRKPLERRMYELARKHCGQQATWSICLTCARCTSATWGEQSEAALDGQRRRKERRGYA
jgi:hypothetical protein